MLLILDVDDHWRSVEITPEITAKEIESFLPDITV